MDYDANEIFQFASTFLIAAERCKVPRKLPNGKLEATLIPALILRAFSIELNLKAIILHDGKKASGHELLNLYQELKDDHKRAIICDMGVSEDAFIIDLSKCSTTFIDWRYMYEKPGLSVNYSFLEKLSSSIHSLAEKTCKRVENIKYEK